MATGVVNRGLYSLLRNQGYRLGLRRQQSRDARDLLYRNYQPLPLKRLLARWRYRSARRDESCNHVDCTCVWCRHGRASHA